MPNLRLLYSSCALAALGLAGLLGAVRMAPADDRMPSIQATPVLVAAPVAPVAPLVVSAHESMLALASSDPLAIARLALARYAETVTDYRCIFLKRERIDGKLREQEEIKVLYRGAPHSVYMYWQKNSDQVKRALFIDRKDFVDGDGEKIAKVEPAGAILRIFVAEVTMQIHGARARAASRRTIDEFGFVSTLRILDKVNALAEKNGELDYRFEGEGTIDGRPTFVFVRVLPLKARTGVYPDAQMILHLDQEWLLPTAVYSYADREGKILLGSYVLTKIEMNPGLTEAEFKF